jgi:hypothetical protein
MKQETEKADQAIVVLADGVRPDVMQDLLDRGDLPGISGLLLEPSGAGLRTAVTAFPSTTGPAHLPFLTGRFPGPCNVPGIRWLDPTLYGRRPWSPFRFRSYMGLGNFLQRWDLAPHVPTIFELVADHASIAGNVRKGVRPARDLTRWGKVVNNVQSFFSEQWGGMDALVEEKLLEAARRGTRFIFCAFYSADAMAHKHGPEHPETLEGYRRVDRALSRLGRWLRQQRGTHRTLIALVSDHGQSATRHHLDLHGLVERVAGPCLAHPLIHRGLFHARSAVMVSGNAMAHVYLQGPGGWGTPLYLDEPTAKLSRLVEALLAEEAVDLLAGRSAAGGAVVVSRRGRARIRDAGHASGLEYQILEGIDPLGYDATVAGRSPHPDRELLSLTWDSDYPDAPAQLLQILESVRCGHLMVSAAPGHDLRARYEKPAHVGSHGSLHRLHMRVPFLLNRPLPPGPIRTVDLFPTVLEALGMDPRSDIDGIPLL